MANRYWVNGTGQWDAANTANWSATSGGASGASVPTSADDVFINGSSDVAGAAFAININTSVACKNLTISGLDAALTFSGSAANTLSLSGSFFTQSTSITWTFGGTFNFVSTATGNTITTNGLILINSFTFNGVGGGWILQDNIFSSSTNKILTLTAGTLDLNSKLFTIDLFNSSGSLTRTLAFGTTGSITVLGNNSRIVDVRTITNLTVTGNRVINSTYAGATGTRNIEVGNLPENSAFSLNVTAGTDIVTPASATAFTNLNFTGFSGSWGANTTQIVYGNLTVSTGMTVTASAASLTFNGSSGTQTITTNGKTIDRPIAFNGTGTGSTCAFAGALTQGSTRAFTIVNGTVQLKNGVPSIVGTFVTSGTAPKFLQSTLAGSQATLSQASGTVNASYLTIKDIVATGGATFNAYTDQNNVNAGNVSGWNFGISPVVGGAEYTYAMRSFTQPRRF